VILKLARTHPIGGSLLLDTDSRLIHHRLECLATSVSRSRTI